MKTTPLKLVTVVAESVLGDRICEEMRSLGAKGFTVSEATGEGSRGLRTSELGGKNVRIEAVVGPDAADRILERLAERYFPHYAIIAFVHDVHVVRGDKYV
ncbi:MAG: transcriptional regulator [Planctomycetes bacterium]|nr:transcriptional regulator [Planctomycetota bacterium]